MKRTIKITSILLVIVMLCSLVACGEKTLSVTRETEHEEKFGGIYIKITIDDFNALGFAFGDSVKIKFSSGFVLEDIPYYNGFYVDTGEPLLVGYPGYPYVRVGYNNGEDMYVKAGLNSGDTAVITLNQKGKYLAEQNAMDIHYSDEQGDRSDAVFANFREVNVGNLKDNTLYCSASPCDNQHKRAATADRLIYEVGVNCIINLSDNEDELMEHINGEDFNSPYFLGIYNAGHVIPLSMSMAYKTETFSQKLADGLICALEIDGPYLVHCVEGKDRTGFVRMVIEAVAGATYDEIVADYMVTYDNYYEVNLQSDSEKYEIIKKKNIDAMLKYITGDSGVDITTADYAQYAKQYLASIGLTSEQISALESRFVDKK